jgi:6-phospho-3-hexuloisomerase
MIFEDAENYLLDKMRETMAYVDKEKVKLAVDMILTTNHVFIYGAGRSGIISKAFAMRLVQLGITAYFIGETITPILSDRDLIILISNQGTTKSTLLVAQISKNIKAKIIVLTSNDNAPLLKFADLSFILKIKKDHSNLAPLGTMFEMSTLLFFDSLIAQLMSAMNENENSMRSRHAIWV